MPGPLLGLGDATGYRYNACLLEQQLFLKEVGFPHRGHKELSDLCRVRIEKQAASEPMAC